MKRRFDYGTSEGLLQQLHPVRGKKMWLPPLLTSIVLLLTLALVGQSLLPLPLAGLLLLVDTFMTRSRISRKGLTLSMVQILLARSRTVGSLAYYVGYHLLRYYLPLLLLTAVVYPPIGLLVLGMLLGVGSVDFRVRTPRLKLAGFFCYYVLEQLSYGSGVFWGCFRMKNFASYRLDLQGASGAL